MTGILAVDSEVMSETMLQKLEVISGPFFFTSYSGFIIKKKNFCRNWIKLLRTWMPQNICTTPVADKSIFVNTVVTGYCPQCDV